MVVKLDIKLRFPLQNSLGVYSVCSDLDCTLLVFYSGVFHCRFIIMRIIDLNSSHFSGSFV